MSTPRKSLARTVASGMLALFAIPIFLGGPGQWLFQNRVPYWLLTIVALLFSSALVGIPNLLRSRNTPIGGSEDTSVAGTAEALAKAIERQWVTEAVLLGLDPDRTKPIEVPWEIVPERSRPGVKRKGTLSEMPALLDEEGVRAIMVVGDPESGKTASTVYMLRALLKRRSEDTGGPRPVPVIFPLCNWDPKEPSLEDWLASQLAEQHTWLKAVDYGKDMPKRLIAAGLILPILDALDEIPGRLQGPADRERLGDDEQIRLREADAVRRRRSVLEQIATGGVDLPAVILSSRRREFDRAVAGVERRRDTVTIALGKLGHRVAARYLKDHVDRPGEEPWPEVFAAIRPGSNLAAALANPLILSLITKVYCHDDDPADPRELLRFGDVESVRERVLLSFAPTRFKERVGRSERRVGKLDRADAMRWLRTLAGRTEGGIRPPIAWWEFSLFARTATRVVAGILGLVLPVMSVGLGVGGLLDRMGTHPAWAYPVGAAVGGAIGAVLGWFAYRNDPPPPSEIVVQVTRDRWLSALKSSLFVYCVALVVCGLVFGLSYGLVLALAFAVPVAATYAFATPDALAKATTPQSLFKRDVRVGYVFAAVYGVPCLVVGTLIAERAWMGVVFGLSAGLAGGLLYGVPWLLAFQGGRSGAAAFVHYGVALAFLAPSGRLPWNAIGFLEEAHDRGILRLQAGGTYAWRHDSIASSIMRWDGGALSVVPPPRPELE